MHPPFSLYRMYLKRKYDVFDKKSDEYTIIEKEGIIKTALDSTISFRHKIVPIVGSNFSGTSDPLFQWALLHGEEYEGIFLSSPGIRQDSLIRRTIGAIYQLGNIDCGMASIWDTKYQRPALRTSAIHDDTHGSVYIAEEKKISYADQLIVKMFFYLHLFDE